MQLSTNLFNCSSFVDSPSFFKMSRTSFLVIGFSNNESKANEKSLTAHILWVAQLSSTLLRQLRERN